MLITRDGRTWRIQVVDNGGSVLFRNGWCAFRNTYKLEAGDSITFLFKNKTEFYVTIYKMSGMENEGSMPAPTTINTESLGNYNRIPKIEPASIIPGKEKRFLLLSFNTENY